MGALNFADPTIPKYLDGDNGGTGPTDAFIQSMQLKLSGTALSSNYGLPITSSGINFQDKSTTLPDTSPHQLLAQNTSRVYLKIHNPGSSPIAWGISSGIGISGSVGSGGANVLAAGASETMQGTTVATNAIYFVGPSGAAVTIFEGTAPTVAVSPTEASGTQAFASAQPASATGSISSAGVMMGYATEITPGVTGKLKVFVQGMVELSDDSDLATIQLQYGLLETLPANGAAIAGTAAGAPIKNVGNTTNAGYTPFTIVAYLTGLAINEEFWFDLAVSVTGGTANLYDVSFFIEELP